MTTSAFPQEPDAPDLVSRTVRLPRAMVDEIITRGQAIDRDFSWMVRNMLGVALAGLNRAEDNAPESLPDAIDGGWEVIDLMGSTGSSYELATTFNLPSMTDGDQWAHGARDRVVDTLTGLNARNVVARLRATRPLEIEHGLKVNNAWATGEPLLAADPTGSTNTFAVGIGPDADRPSPK